MYILFLYTNFHLYLCVMQTDTKNISAVSIFFETMPYRLDESTGYIDYDQVGRQHCISVLWTCLFQSKTIFLVLSSQYCFCFTCCHLYLCQYASVFSFNVWLQRQVLCLLTVLFIFLACPRFKHVLYGLTYLIYLQMEKSAALFRPKLIVAGASAYARLYEYARIRKVSYI